MPVNRFNQGSKTTTKPRALNSVKKTPVKKPGKTLSKERSSKKTTSPPSVSPGFSLYSSDSESSAGVSSLNHGLDRCAALLANILEEDDTLGVPSKTSSTKKQSSPSRQPSKGGKQTSRPTTRQTHSLKKSKQGQSVTKKSASNKPNTTKPEGKASSRPKVSDHNAKPFLQVKIPQSTQFNNRLVSSTPDMGSPTSDHHESRCVGNTDMKQAPNLPPPYRNSSLETLAAQIQMLRSQAEINEKLSEHHDQIPVRDTQGCIPPGGVVHPSAFQYEKVRQSEPRQLIQSLTDHLKDRNMKQQVFPIQTSKPENNYGIVHERRHQFNLNRATPDPHNDRSTGGQSATSVPSHSAYQQTPNMQLVEPPELRNTSYIAEYHQLPDTTIQSSPHGPMILQQLNDIQTSVTPPVLNHSKLQSGQVINQVVTSNDPVNCKQMSNQSSVQVDTVIPTQLQQTPQQNRSIQIADHEKQQTENTRNPQTITDDPIFKVCAGTQTYSPPADKGVQTSIVSSPSSSDDNSVPTKDTPERTLHPQSTKETLAQDTPRPQPKMTGKKNASWEQMRVLKYLIGELRAAIIGDIGEDSDVQRLLSEIEECLDTLRYLPPDLQTEIGLALQPLRSENSQLRRRLRIANQHIKRLEKGEDKENVDPLVDVEVLTLQSLNAKLQKELREGESKHKRMVKSNEEYATTIDNMKQKQEDLMKVLQQKDAHQLDSRQEWMEEKSALNNQLDEMRSQLRELQLRVDATNNENRILKLNLEQRDADIAQLQHGFSTKHINISERESVTESDEDDDDETPTASLQHTPKKMYGLSWPSARLNNHEFLNQHSETPDRTTQYRIPNNYSDKDYPQQNNTRRVTFAEYVSPKHTNYRTEMAGAIHRHDTYNDGGEHTMPQYHHDQWAARGQYGSDMDVTRVEQETSDPIHLIHSRKADEDFPMRKFLEPSRHFSSDEDAPGSDHGHMNKPNQAYVYPSNSIPDALHANTSGDFVEDRTHQSRQPNNYNTRSYNNNMFPTSQDEVFRQQGPSLDGSISVIDSSSTQSSVTSQYEAQFQLGLANLDSEIEKLQNSLKSMDSRKPIHDLQR